MCGRRLKAFLSVSVVLFFSLSVYSQDSLGNPYLSPEEMTTSEIIDELITINSTLTESLRIRTIENEELRNSVMAVQDEANEWKNLYEQEKNAHRQTQMSYRDSLIFSQNLENDRNSLAVSLEWETFIGWIKFGIGIGTGILADRIIIGIIGN